MIKDEETKNRSQQWEDEAPAEPRFRRPRPVTSAQGPEDDEHDEPRWARKRSEFDEPRSRWAEMRSRMLRPLLIGGILVALSGAAIGAFLLKTSLSRDDRFRIASTENIEASGLSEVSRSEMLPVFGEDIGRNIFFVPLRQRRHELEQIPWVKQATVMRLLPDHLRVNIVERQPVAFARTAAGIGLVDAEGVLLTMPPEMMAARHYSFPVLSGIDAADSPSMRQARMGVYLRMIAELDASGQKLSHQISEVDLTNPEDARVQMQDDPVLLHFGSEKFLERYRRYLAQIATFKQQYPHISAVDLRYEQMAVVDTHQSASDLPRTFEGAAPAAPAPLPAQTSAPAPAPPAAKPGREQSASASAKPAARRADPSPATAKPESHGAKKSEAKAGAAKPEPRSAAKGKSPARASAREGKADKMPQSEAGKSATSREHKTAGKAEPQQKKARSLHSAEPAHKSGAAKGDKPAQGHAAAAAKSSRADAAQEKKKKNAAQPTVQQPAPRQRSAPSFAPLSGSGQGI